MSEPLQKTEVQCPHCQHRQREPVGVISTVCRQCHQNFRVAELPRKKVSKLPRETRTVVCYNCQHEQHVVAAAMSTQCERCSSYLNFRDYEITDESRETITTYGRVLFAAGCDYRGAPVRAEKVEIRGRVQAKLFVNAEVRVAGQGQSSHLIKTPLLWVEAKAQARLARIEVGRLRVEGVVKLQEAVVRDQLHVSATGELWAETIDLLQAAVEDGGQLHGEVVLHPEWLETGEAEAAVPPAEAKTES